MKKTLSFALTHFSVAFLVTYILTGDLLIGGLVAVIEPAINTLAYYFHEKIWSKHKLAKSNKRDYPHANTRKYGTEFAA